MHAPPRRARVRRVRRPILAVVAGVLALALVAPSSSATPAVQSSRSALQQAREQLRTLNVQLSLAAEALHQGRVLLATLRGDLAAARARSDRTAAAAAAARDAFDAMVRWTYENGASQELGVLGLGSVSDLSEGVGLLAAMATNQEQIASDATDARERAAAADGQTSSLEAQVTSALAGQHDLGAQLHEAALEQQDVIDGLERQLHHRIKLAIADRRAAAAAAAVARAAQEQQTPSPGPTTTGGGTGPLPGPSEPIPTTGEVVDLITSLWGTGADGQVARCVAWRESRYQATARNTSSGAAGLFQLMPFWWDGNNEFGWSFDPYDAQQNAIHAHLIWKVYGWEPWTTGHLCV
jgi:hypothetical protein